VKEVGPLGERQYVYDENNQIIKEIIIQ